MGTCLQYSLDFCLAWALIGEWTSRVLFPVPKGPWPRHGHAGALLQNYQCRSPRIVAWARAAFEQGALPSLLMMPGLAPVLSLPGDRMFQATEITAGHQRPATMHAYGGAKVGMEKSLSSIAAEGWIPMAAAMLGTEAKPPMWASIGLRPVAGTTIDFRGAASLPLRKGETPSLTFPPSNTRPTSRRFHTPSAPQPVLPGAKAKASSPTAHLSTLRAKAKARENPPPKALRKDPRKAPIRAPRKDQPKALAKGPARAKAKAKEKERATNNSGTIHFLSLNGIHITAHGSGSAI